MVRPIWLAPSLLAADLADLAGAVRAVEGEADLIHFDVMDGQFVPNITFGPPVLHAVAAKTAIPMDVHLMIVDPDRYIERFVSAGATWLTVHAEAATHLHRTLGEIRRLGARAGVALNPATPVHVLEHVLDLVDQVLVMTVNPGFGGQRFLSELLPKVSQVARLTQGREIRVAVDGGVGLENIGALVDAGADLLVAGSSVYGNQPREALRALRQAARGGEER